MSPSCNCFLCRPVLRHTHGRPWSSLVPIACAELSSVSESASTRMNSESVGVGCMDAPSCEGCVSLRGISQESGCDDAGETFINRGATTGPHVTSESSDHYFAFPLKRVQHPYHVCPAHHHVRLLIATLRAMQTQRQVACGPILNSTLIHFSSSAASHAYYFTCCGGGGSSSSSTTRRSACRSLIKFGKRHHFGQMHFTAIPQPLSQLWS